MAKRATTMDYMKVVEKKREAAELMKEANRLRCKAEGKSEAVSKRLLDEAAHREAEAELIHAELRRASW